MKAEWPQRILGALTSISRSTPWACSPAATITHQTLYKKYDLFKQSVPISSLATAPFCLMVPPQSPFRTVEDLLKAIRERPGRISMATGGYGSGAHMAFAVLTWLSGRRKAMNVNEQLSKPPAPGSRR